MTTRDQNLTQPWQAEFDELLSEARTSLNTVLRDGAIECPVFLYFRPSRNSSRGELRLARTCPDGGSWQRHQMINVNNDVRGIMAQVTVAASMLPVLAPK